MEMNLYIPDIWDLVEDSISNLVDDFDITLNYHDLLGLSALHSESRRILSPYLYHNNSFCNKVKSDPHKLPKCILQKSKALDHAKDLSEPFYGYCYMGYEEMVFPVMCNDTLIGVIFIGRLDKVKGNETSLFKSVYMLMNLLTSAYNNFLKTVTAAGDNVIDAATLKTNNTIARTIQFIEDNLSAPLSLEILAHNAYVNPTYLSSIFKRHVGTGIANYIQKNRLQATLYHLVNSSRPVTEIALDVGISDPAYFSRLFSRHYGMSPTQYRKKHTV